MRTWAHTAGGLPPTAGRIRLLVLNNLFFFAWLLGKEVFEALLSNDPTNIQLILLLVSKVVGNLC